MVSIRSNSRRSACKSATSFERKFQEFSASTLNSTRQQESPMPVPMPVAGKNSGERLLATSYNNKWELKKSKPSLGYASIFGADMFAESLKPLKRSVSQPCSYSSEASTRPGSSTDGSATWESEGNQSWRGSNKGPSTTAARRSSSRPTLLPGRLNKEGGFKPKTMPVLTRNSLKAQKEMLGKCIETPSNVMERSTETPSVLSRADRHRRASSCLTKPLVDEIKARSYCLNQPEVPKSKSKKPVCLAYLAHKWKFDLHTVQDASEFFNKHAKLPAGKEDIHVDGVLSQKAMIKVACEICQVDRVSDMTEDAKEIMIMVDTNGDGCVSFEEFAVWYSNRAFVSCVSVDKKQNEVRDLGHKLGMTVVEMETYQEMYEKFDADGSGDVDYEEFSELLHKCMRVPTGSFLADTRVKKLWHECDIDGSGGIDLEEFVIFYRNHFGTEANDSGTVDNYYSNIRRSSFSIAKPGQY